MEMETATAEFELMNEAAEWRLLSLLFDCPNADWFSQIQAISEQVSDEKLKRAAIAARSEATEGLFHSVFGPGGPAPGREVSYRGWVQPGLLLSELNGYYDAFAYKPLTHEVPDHVAVETGFISYMKLKELFALECRDTENAEIASQAAAAFKEEHLSKYAQTLSKLLAASGYEYLQLAGEVLFDRVGPDKDKGKQIFLPVIEEDDDPNFECGSSAL